MLRDVRTGRQEVVGKTLSPAPTVGCALLMLDLSPLERALASQDEAMKRRQA